MGTHSAYRHALCLRRHASFLSSHGTTAATNGNGTYDPRESMKNVAQLLRLIPACVGFALGFNASISVSRAEETRFDVNDISILWPVPTTKDDVAQLISADEMVADGTTHVWPKPA